MHECNAGPCEAASVGNTLKTGDLELIESLLRTGTMSHTAQEFGTEPSTVSRRLGQLEGRLGTELFVRSSKGLVPTPLAKGLQAQAEQIVGSLRSAEQFLSHGQESVQGTLRLTMPEGIAQFAFVPLLVEFIDQHPGLELELIDGAKVLNLAAAEADLAIRAVRPTAGDVVSQRLFVDTLAPFAAPSYLARKSERLRWLGWTREYDRLPESQALRAFLPREPDLRFTRYTTMIAAAKAGAGVMLLGRVFGEYLGLEMLQGEYPNIEVSLWIAAPRALRHTPAVASAWAWITERMHEQFST